ncbi:MAG: translation initiation factor IF-3 [Firmicutes bacterium]|nr:translation initiation factor IF-3 [Bacillota bacterium]
MFKEHLINTQIKAQELRVIAESGEQLGVMSLSQALRMSDEAELDLVLISPNASPPVARIIDYGKYKFDSLRKEKEQKKASKQNKIKEVQLSLNIQENEVAFKMAAAKRFVEQGFKVKIAINKIRGRATMNADKGVALLVKFAEGISDVADIEQPPTKGGVPGRNMSIVMVVAPKKVGKK